MSNEFNLKTNPGRPMPYQIRFKGHLGCEWTDWFDNLTLTLEENGETLLTGPVADQAALYGLLKKIRDLGMPLISINLVRPDQVETFEARRQVHSIKHIKSISHGEKTMNTDKQTPGIDMKTRLSILWVFLLFNMVFADIFSFMYPGALEQIITGTNGVQVTPAFLLIAAIVNEIPIAMVFLSRLLKYRANRWINIVGGVITILYVIGGGSTTLHYIFFATMEIICALFIVWYAWKWIDPDGQTQP